MQCPSCGFQNLPGLSSCARCMSTLMFENIDVQPYRAGTLRSYRLRLFAGVRGLRVWTLLPFARRVSAYVAEEVRGIRLGGRVRPGTILASLVPGLGLMLAGEHRRGRLVMLGYAVALIASIVFMAHAWTLFYAAVISLHAYSIVATILLGAPYILPRTAVLTGLLVVLMLQVFLYMPLAWGAHHLVWFQQLGGDIHGTRMLQGDVLAVEGTWFRPVNFGRGDVVSYRMRAGRGQGWYTAEGLSVDRILAMAGDRVTSVQGTIHVNGRPPQHPGSAKPTLLPDGYAVTVPPGTYFIYPRGARLRAMNRGNTDAEAIMSVCLVPQRDVIGRTWGVVSPLTRIGRP